jgi:cell division protease FtsH
MKNRTRFNVWYWIAAAVGILLVQYVVLSAAKVATIPYSQFESDLKAGKIAEVAVSDKYIHGTLKEPLPGGQKQFVTTRVDPDFAAQLQKYDVRYTGHVPSTFLTDLLSWVIPIGIFALIWMFLIRRAGAGGLGGGLMQIGKSKARIYVEADTGVTFDDVAGVDEAKDELKEIIAFLKDPESYGRLGGRMPKGVLHPLRGEARLLRRPRRQGAACRRHRRLPGQPGAARRDRRLAEFVLVAVGRDVLQSRGLDRRDAAAEPPRGDGLSGVRARRLR